MEPTNLPLWPSFITHMVKYSTRVNVYLTNGTKLSGVVTDHGTDAITFTGRTGNPDQLIMLASIATIEPLEG